MYLVESAIQDCSLVDGVPMSSPNVPVGRLGRLVGYEVKGVASNVVVTVTVPLVDVATALVVLRLVRGEEVMGDLVTYDDGAGCGP